MAVLKILQKGQYNVVQSTSQWH